MVPVSLWKQLSSVALDFFISASLILTRCDNGLVAHATITFSYLLLAQERRESQARGWQIHGWRRRSGLGTLSGLVDPPHVLYR